MLRRLIYQIQLPICQNQQLNLVSRFICCLSGESDPIKENKNLTQHECKHEPFHQCCFHCFILFLGNVFSCLSGLLF
jgi:hypothetical protein